MARKFEKFKGWLVQAVKSIPIGHVLILGLVLAIFYVFIWIVISQQSGQTVAKHIRQFEQQDINISFIEHENIGFPASFSTIIKGLKYLNQDKNFGWKTQQITIPTPVIKSNVIHIDASDSHFFLLKTDKMQKITLQHKQGNISLASEKNQLNNIHVDSYGGVVQFSDPPEVFSYAKFDLNIKDSHVIVNGDLINAIKADFRVKNIRPTKFWKDILEDNFQYIQGNVYLINPNRLSEFPIFKKYLERNYDPPEIIINNLEIAHPLSKINLEGIVTFTPEMKLNGEILLRIQDYKSILKLFTKKGVVSDQIATNFRFMFSFLTSSKILQKSDGSVDLSLNVKDSVVYNGKVKLFELKI